MIRISNCIDRHWIHAQTAGWVLIVSSLVAAPLAWGQHDHDGHSAVVAKPRVFLDKSPRIVQYQLRRLSNAQLLLVDQGTDDPKYIPVFQAILTRPGMSVEPRERALDGLMSIKGTSVVEELLGILTQLDITDRNQGLVCRQLIRMLVNQPSDNLRDGLTQIRAAVNDQHEAVSVAAFASVLQLGLQDEAWRVAQPGESQRLAYLKAVRHLEPPASRVALQRNVNDCLDPENSTEIRRAAIETLATIPSSAVERFQALAPLTKTDALRPAAIRALLQMPHENWPESHVSELLVSLVEHIESIPAADRTSASELDGLQLADDLLAMLPAEHGRPYRERLRSVTVRVVQIGTVHEEMRFDKPFFAVEVGRPVQIVLRNDDAMPHNLVLAVPDSLREVAMLAEQMGSTLGADGKQYVPESELVLHATTMVQPGQLERLVFDAPRTPGDYPFVCTFPRHWMRMYGVMVVVEDLDEWLANPRPPADPLGNTRPVVKQWTPQDFAELDEGLRGRTAEIGQRLFTEATCAQCHKVRGVGGAVGPELTDVLSRWKGDKSGILREMLDPSYKVEPKYAMHTVLTDGGQVLSGVVTAQDAKTLTIVTNPEAPQPQVVQRDEIDEIIQSTASMMPKGLLDRFSREEIFELLAYIISP